MKKDLQRRGIRVQGLKRSVRRMDERLRNSACGKKKGEISETKLCPSVNQQISPTYHWWK